MKSLKVSSLFHWLYGAVMFLPILLLPVFMIYSHRHDINDGTLQVQETQAVNYNQLIPNVNLQSNEYFNVTKLNDYYYNFQGSFDGERSYVLSEFDDLPIDIDSRFYVRGVTTSTYITYRFYSHDVISGTYFQDVNLTTSNDYISLNLNRFTSIYRIALIKWNSYTDFNFSLHLQVFNASQMYGLGNEPTYSEFLNIFPKNDYDYSLSKNMLVNKPSLTTFDDTDIMSQVTYQLYNATDKYFNISQFFGLENLWKFMVLNWFGGNVTIYLRIFWQLLTYWLVVSIAWLIFDLFMYVPNLAHRWLDRSAIE